MDTENPWLMGLLGMREACEFLGIRRSTLYKLIADGALDSVHIGSRHLVPVDTCTEYIRRLVEEQHGTQPPTL